MISSHSAKDLLICSHHLQFLTVRLHCYQSLHSQFHLYICTSWTLLDSFLGVLVSGFCCCFWLVVWLIVLCFVFPFYLPLSLILLPKTLTKGNVDLFPSLNIFFPCPMRFCSWHKSIFFCFAPFNSSFTDTHSLYWHLCHACSCLSLSSLTCCPVLLLLCLSLFYFCYSVIFQPLESSLLLLSTVPNDLLLKKALNQDSILITDSLFT